MKAILEYGQFTTMIQLPTILPEVSVIKPPQGISLLPIQEVVDVTEVTSHRLDFRFKQQLTDDLVVYTFERES